MKVIVSKRSLTNRSRNKFDFLPPFDESALGIELITEKYDGMPESRRIRLPTRHDLRRLQTLSHEPPLRIEAC